MDPDDETPRETAFAAHPFADDPAVIARAEADYGLTQAETAELLIERSCWRDLVPALVGRK